MVATAPMSWATGPPVPTHLRRAPAASHLQKADSQPAWVAAMDRSRILAVADKSQKTYNEHDKSQLFGYLSG
jgi:hypothetical protein